MGGGVVRAGHPVSGRHAATRRYLLDAGERVGATAVAAGLGVAVQELADLDGWWAPVLITLFTVAKVALAKRVGDPDSAAARPADREEPVP